MDRRLHPPLFPRTNIYSRSHAHRPANNRLKERRIVGGNLGRRFVRRAKRAITACRYTVGRSGAFAVFLIAASQARDKNVFTLRGLPPPAIVVVAAAAAAAPPPSFAAIKSNQTPVRLPGGEERAGIALPPARHTADQYYIRFILRTV